VVEVVMVKEAGVVNGEGSLVGEAQAGEVVVVKVVGAVVEMKLGAVVVGWGVVVVGWVMVVAGGVVVVGWVMVVVGGVVVAGWVVVVGWVVVRVVRVEGDCSQPGSTPARHGELQGLHSVAHSVQRTASKPAGSIGKMYLSNSMSHEFDDK
jgi:hypothetical protein